MQVIVSQTKPISGHLVLMRDSDRRMEPGASALVLAVGGDTLISVASILEDHKRDRPMALDLLWQVLFTLKVSLDLQGIHGAAFSCMHGTRRTFAGC